LIKIPIKKKEIKIGIIDGRMAIKERADVISEFETDNEFRVLLVSMKACGLGINLVMANHVFFLDPWYFYFIIKKVESFYIFSMY
jgi:SNF2 family DNA or RNA helicase